MKKPKSTLPPPSKWGLVDLSKPVGTILPPGMYDATVADVKVLDGDEALRLIITFEIVTDQGEIVAPDSFWMTIAAIPKSQAEKQLREGLRDLGKLAQAVGLSDNLTDVHKIEEELIGKKLQVKITRSGSGVNMSNRVVAFAKSA
jgi:hypothetical protein